jgi:hypothetical protein
MKEPRKEVFSTEAEMRARADVLKAGGREIVELEDPERGMVGVLAYAPPPEGRPAPENWEEDVVLLEWPKYGRPLERIETIVETAEVLQGAFNEHCGHDGFKPFTNPMNRTAGIVCHCLAGVGKSVVFTVPLFALKELPPELLREIVPQIFKKAGTQDS